MNIFLTLPLHIKGLKNHTSLNNKYFDKNNSYYVFKSYDERKTPILS